MKNTRPGVVDIDVGEFSKTPYGRFADDGDYNGEKFRDNVLLKNFLNPEVHTINVYLDTVEEGYEYGSSFLEEAFGGLIRIHGLNKEDVLRKLNVVTEHTDYAIEIKDYISVAR
ncbi:STAS-like domain-containing protein [Stutzerimonas stutzeri]|uniref:STAS-like domain-containing protein n=1 Tax=Stutzerimonas stutzeri TaxID=316 RepID=UPI001C44F76D|nr:DUF4325 domain-containing protein [Stutzerimonas stutzeri]